VRPIIDSVQEQDVNAETLEVLHGQYEFKDVSFKYDDGMPLVLTDLNMVFEAGKVTALVGPSGSGKTSAIRLLSALEYPTSGQLLIDGRDIRSVEAHSLRSKLGVVVQGGTLANGSILDNIGGGVEISEDLAWDVAKQANIADDINAMPMKMHTIVSPLTLSGGQAQRILVARALAKNPEVLLLDEATSALDNVSQAVITEVLSTLKITQILIAQRLSTLQSADKIYVLDRGKVVEEGTYDTLLAAGGLFADLARRQLVGS
jgi:ABC-type bacteriocin/lantibiotic exporter with double-glycine peptidase domain